MTEIKQLQQEVQDIQDRERAREVEVEVHQSEAACIIHVMQPLKEKIETISQSIDAGPSKHISTDRVEQLVVQAEEVSNEVAGVQRIMKEFQDKVGPMVQSPPES